MKRTFSRILVGFFVSCLFSLPIFAAITGDISGTVIDPHGAVIANATVTVKSLTTGTVRTVTTSDIGQFSVPQLELGTYEVRIEKTGFKVHSEKAIVRSGENTRLSASLEVGTAESVVTVDSVTPTLDVATA
jgi:Carboxypeptidase regulatory-like domain